MANRDKKTILIIEDNPFYLEIIENALINAGFQTKNAESASEGLRLIHDFTPHLILLNNNLEDLSGKDLIVALRSNGLKMPIIVIADQLENNHAIQLFRLSASDFIIPPFRENEIITVVERVLTNANQLADQITHTNQLSQTIQTLKKNLNELAIVFAIQKSLNTLTHQNQILEFIYRAISRYLNASSSYQISVDDKEKLILKHTLGLEALPNARLNQEWRDELAIYLSFAKTPLLAQQEELTKYNLSHIGKTALAYPFLLNNQLRAIFVFIRKNGADFNQDDLNFVDLIAQQALTAIHALQTKKKLKQRTQDKQFLEKRLNLLLHENQKTNKRLTEAIEPNLAQNQIILFELKSNPNIDPHIVDTMIENLLEIEKNVKLFKLNFEYLKNLSLQELCLNNLLEEIITPHSPQQALFVYEADHNLYVSDKNETLEPLLKELLAISLKHRAHKPIIIKLETTKNNFVKISFRNPNKIIDYEANLMLFDSLYEKEVLPLPSKEEIEERKKTSTLKQIIYLDQGLIWAEKNPTQGNFINLTLPISADSFAKLNKDHS